MLALRLTRLRQQKPPAKILLGVRSILIIGLAAWIAVGILGSGQNVLAGIPVRVLGGRQDGLTGVRGVLVKQSFHFTHQIAGVKAAASLLLSRVVRDRILDLAHQKIQCHILFPILPASFCRD